MTDRDLDSADYKRFLAKKGIAPHCPLCGSAHWSVVSETDGQSYQFPLLDRKNSNILNMKSSAFLLLVCANCAFTAPLLREKIASELEGENG
jgi:hypothetical protein